ncbi:MAG: hypothetical protein AAF298_09485 [Cyanobacteria bacterium P01_A01_bin.40]
MLLRNLFINLSITKVFLTTFILLLKPMPTQAESKQAEADYQQSPQNTAASLSHQFLVPQEGLTQYILVPQDNKTILQPRLDNSLSSSLTLEAEKERLQNELKIKRIVEQIIPFQAGVASWQTSTKLGWLKLDGNFDSFAHLIKGKAYWKTETILGLVDVLVNVDQQINLLNTATAWKANTVLGSLAIKGNFNEQISFTGANASWNADTPLGSVAVKGNFNHQADFSGGYAAWNAQTSLGSLAIKGNFTPTDFNGGQVKVETKALIGSLKANIKIDEETHFSGANASWNANLILGSKIGVNGIFDENTTFTGGSIKLDAKSALGVLGIKANVDRDTQFTSGSAFWETRAGLGAIGFHADLTKDGDYKSELSIKFPL